MNQLNSCSAICAKMDRMIRCSTQLLPGIATAILGLPLLAGLLLSWPTAAEGRDGETLPEFKRVVIDENPPRQPWYKMVGDVTGDGHLEVVVAGRAGPIVMYSRPDWKKTVIAKGGHDGGVRGSLADINDNGRLDLVMGGVVWFENPGRPGGEWKVHRIDRQGIHDVLVADLTGNGRLDVVGRDQSAFGGRGNAIYIYYQQEPNVWKKEVIECPHGEGLALADVDGDGRIDILINGTWYRNEPGQWTPHVFAAEWKHPDVKVDVADINGNGRIDIVMTPAELRNQRYRISWFESPAGDKTQPWKEHVIVRDVECVVHSLALGDFNNDGTIDLAYAEMHQGAAPNEVVVMFNFDNGARWEKRVIDEQGSHDIIAADLTGNGALDIVGANHDGDSPVVIWKNQPGSDRSASAPPAPLDQWTYIRVDSSRASRKFGLAMGDLNGNGLADIASGQYVYVNPGGGMTETWTRRELPAADLDALLVLNVNDNQQADIIAMNSKGDVFWLEATDRAATAWTSRKIGSLGAADHDISSQGYVLGQLHPGSKPQIILNIANNLSYFEIPGNPEQTPWPRRVISATTYKEDVAVADMDNDGHNDVISTLTNSTVAWWRNPGTGAEHWEHFVIGSTPGPVADRIKVGDINGNGRLDVVVSAANGKADGLYLFEQPEAGPTAGSWPRRTIARTGSMNSMDLADMNGNGHLDIIAGEHRGGLILALWENDGVGQFTRHVVDQGKESHLGSRVHDLNGNGRPDIISIAWDRYQHLHVWRNDAP